jgi:hypothetical protein
VNSNADHLAILSHSRKGPRSASASPTGECTVSSRGPSIPGVAGKTRPAETPSPHLGRATIVRSWSGA